MLFLKGFLVKIILFVCFVSCVDCQALNFFGKTIDDDKALASVIVPSMPCAIVALFAIAIAAAIKIDKIRRSKYFYSNKNSDGITLPDGEQRLVLAPEEMKSIKKTRLARWGFVLSSYLALAMAMTVVAVPIEITYVMYLL